MLSQFTQPSDSEKETLAAVNLPPDVYPLGRLDWDSEGLLLLSDDGALNHELLNPNHGHARTYMVQVENIPADKALHELETGVVIEGKRTLPAGAKLIPEPKLPERPVPIRVRKNIPTAWVSLTLREGRNRQVRKMTAAVGHPTLRLVRSSIGSLTLEGLGLEPGYWRELTMDEVMLAFAE